MDNGGNVIEELVADHHEVDALFARIDAASGDAGELEKASDLLTMALVRHTVAEEAYVYPAVRKHVENGDALADKAIADLGRIERLLKDMEHTEPGAADFTALLAQVRTAAAEHAAGEEAGLFPLLAAAVPPDELDHLGVKVRQAKRGAPTRPHPSAPDTNPVRVKLFARKIGFVDRFRDTLTGRGQD